MKHCILYKLTLFLLGNLMLMSHGWAQVKDIKFNHIGLKEGLSHRKVYSVLRDSKGFVWFGTRDGLNLYDGYEITTYRHHPKDSNSLSSNHIQVVFEDSYGYIWIGTYDGGLNVYDRYRHTFRSFRHNPEDPHSIGSDNIYDIYEDSKKQLWIGTYGGGLCRFDRAQQNFKVFKHKPDDVQSLSNNAVFDIIEDKGKLWLATFGGGLNVFDPVRQTWDTVYQYVPGYESTIPTNDLYSLCKDLAGNLWIGTYGKGLVKLDATTGRFITYTHQSDVAGTVSSNYIVSLAPDALGNLWIGTQDGGINYLEPGKEKFSEFRKNQLNKFTIQTDHVNAVYLDNSGMLWVATDGEGVQSTNAQSVIFDNFVGDSKTIPGFSAKSITAIYEDSRGSIWAGTFGEGVYRFDSTLQKVESFGQDIFSDTGLAGNFITAIAEDREQNIWIGTLNEGISRYDVRTRQWHTYQHRPGQEGSLSNNTINTLHIDKNGNLWVGTDGGGLNKFNHQTETFSSFVHDPYHPDKSLVGNAVKVIYEDENSLWLGTKYSGISRLHLNSLEFQNLKYSADGNSELPSNEIVDITKDKQGRLWVGTFDKGICRVDLKSKSYAVLTMEDGLVSDNICSLLDSRDGYIWVSTTQGLSRLDPASRQFQNYSTEDGLYNTEFVQWARFRNHKDELFLGHLGGFVRFRSDKLAGAAHEAPVYVTSFKLFDEKVQLDTPNFALDHIELKHNDNFFEFEYALLNFKNPNESEYAYFMENLDQNWKPVGQRRIASYTNLDAGTYVFKVKARSKNGSWHEIFKPVTIIIHPAWYHTWWFRGAASAVVIGLCLLYYYNKINTIKERNEQLEVLVAERTSELVEKSEEIRAQKENIEEQNNRLVEVQAIIKERNNELRIMNEELEDRVEQRTRELKITNLELQKANEELDTFVYRSYHDIIGPISRIQGLCYVASMDVKDTVALEYIGRLSESGDKAKHTLLRVLSIYHIRNHEIKMEELDILELIYNITAHFEKQLGDTQLDIVYEKEFYAVIKSDKELLRTILLNLIENAVKYRHHVRKSCIRITLSKLDGALSVQIADNGIGILPDVRNKVFTMFFRGDNERSGTGLGLYLTRIAVHKLNGNITYQHTETNETHFELRLPAMPDGVENPAKLLQEKSC